MTSNFKYLDLRTDVQRLEKKIRTYQKALEDLKDEAQKALDKYGEFLPAGIPLSERERFTRELDEQTAITIAREVGYIRNIVRSFVMPTDEEDEDEDTEWIPPG